MIDDDFESVFKRMIEQFMSAFGIPEGNIRIESWNDSMVKEPLATQIVPNSDEPIIEKIDLGDSMLILIEGQMEIETPNIRVSGSTIFIQLSPSSKEIKIEVEFLIDLEKSNVSHRNGIMEISVVKAESESRAKTDGFLKVD
ncbi:MAG: hypothetical protein ACFFCX_10440 [Candidatus Sifarchaeia archaeon]